MVALKSLNEEIRCFLSFYETALLKRLNRPSLYESKIGQNISAGLKLFITGVKSRIKKPDYETIKEPFRF